jgi:mono/diheme cytochrome c family protein
MKKQDKYKPQAGSPLFSDGRAMRAPDPGTIARDREPEVDAVMNTGMLNGQYVGKMPVKIDADLLKIGQQKFNIYCAPCHDKAGSGKGIVAIRTPAWQPTNLHELRLVNTADGDIFWTITNGRRSMPAYKYQISDPRDRWAVVAYVRALQRSWLGTMQDLPQTLRAEVR